jgi:hypothetical protein
MQVSMIHQSQAHAAQANALRKVLFYLVPVHARDWQSGQDIEGSTKKGRVSKRLYAGRDRMKTNRPSLNDIRQGNLEQCRSKSKPTDGFPSLVPRKPSLGLAHRVPVGEIRRNTIKVAQASQPASKSASQ